MKQIVALVALAALGAWSSASAAAQSCPAPPASAVCSAPAPKDGQSFAGPVLQVMDHGRVCVALGPLPNQWVAVEIADAPTDASRDAWMAAVFSHTLECVSTGGAPGGVRARCLSDGASVARLIGERHDSAVTTLAWR